jgi:transposase
MPGSTWQEKKSPSMPSARKYSQELLDRGARLVFESGRPIAHVARDLGIESETLCKHVRQVEANEGRRKDVLSSQEREEIKTLSSGGRPAAPREMRSRRPPACFSRASSIHTVRSERVRR